jgi:hypothetical protein
MTIRKFLDLSTCHLTAGDAMRLPELEVYGLRIQPHDYGWFVSVPQDPEERAIAIKTATATGLSDAFVTCIAYAAARDCWWINFDSDGDTDSALPVFDW